MTNSQLCAINARLKTQNERLKTLLYNALIWIEEENADYFYNVCISELEWYKKTLGITKRELKNIGIDYLDD